MKQENLLFDLTQAGFTSNEARAYLALIGLGEATSGQVAAQSGLHHTRAYESLTRLIHKGFASFVIKNKTKRFSPCKPGQIMEKEREKERKLEVLVEKLSSLQVLQEGAPAAEIYQGKHGIRTLLDFIMQSLGKNEEYLDFGVSGAFRETMGPYWDRWQIMKKERLVASRVLFEEKLRGSKLHHDYSGHARFVPSKFHCPSDSIIFHDSVAIFMWSSSPVSAVLITEKATAQGYRNIFEWMWQNAKK